MISSRVLPLILWLSGPLDSEKELHQAIHFRDLREGSGAE